MAGTVVEGAIMLVCVVGNIFILRRHVINVKNEGK